MSLIKRTHIDGEVESRQGRKLGKKLAFYHIGTSGILQGTQGYSGQGSDVIAITGGIKSMKLFTYCIQIL
jgi:hypothetical protein